LKIVITGASGYVGKNIVPILKENCEKILLVGRDVEKLSKIYPDMPSCEFEQMSKYAQGFDYIVHLSVLNNNTSGSDTDFCNINVNLAIDTANTAAACGIKKFFNVSSVHALNDHNQSPYARSKREAVSQLACVSGIEVVNLYLPFVRGNLWNGKTAFLNKTPRPVAKPLKALLLALKPSVRAQQVASFLINPDAHQTMVILSEGQSDNIVYNVAKRGIDLLFAVSVIALLWWALLIVWGLVRYGSPGPGIFAQERVGLNGETFTCYKFRTMRDGTVQAGTHEISQSSVTPIGHFLRGTKLDELPQVWNILKNEVSLIGPRPGLPVQKELYDARASLGVFSVKPGISGLAQVNDIDMSDPKKLARWDSHYIAMQSISTDLSIILATLKGGGQGDQTKS
tara:strand:- start:1724 stop:2917 length:1194 start_codon:yes stop_codon:yes gene_type:complete